MGRGKGERGEGIAGAEFEGRGVEKGERERRRGKWKAKRIAREEGWRLENGKQETGKGKMEEESGKRRG
jgi:hypothetical protein